MRRLAAMSGLVLVVLSSAVPSGAQGRLARRCDLGAEVERAHITEDDGFLGAGVGVSAGGTCRLGGAAFAGVDVGRVRYVRDLGRFAVAFDPAGRPEAFPYEERWEGTATFLSGRLGRTFGGNEAPVRPLVWGGVGAMWHGGTTRGPRTQPVVPAGYRLQAGELDRRAGRSTTASFVEGGGGLDLRVASRWRVQPFAGLRLVGTGNVGPKYILRAGVRIAARL